MPKLVPINSACFFGVPIKTVNPLQKAIYFMKPPIGKRGNAYRLAKENYDKIRKAGKLENESDLEFSSRLMAAGMAVLVESAKLQYYFIFEKDEEKQDENVLFFEHLSDCFTDGDIDRILFSIDFGKEFSFMEMIEEGRKQKEMIDSLRREEEKN